jgi:hypothetical protein
MTIKKTLQAGCEVISVTQASKTWLMQTSVPLSSTPKIKSRKKVRRRRE